jgi:hypothetical protein
MDFPKQREISRGRMSTPPGVASVQIGRQDPANFLGEGEMQSIERIFLRIRNDFSLIFVAFNCRACLTNVDFLFSQFPISIKLPPPPREEIGGS